MKGNKIFKKIDRFIGIPFVLFFGILTKIWDFSFYSKPPQLTTGDRVLVIKLSALGDTFLLLPIFKALKEKVGPTGKILMIATPINQAALKGVPYIDEILLLDFGKFFKNPNYFWYFFKNLKHFKSNLALDFDQWLRISPLLCFLSGATLRYGFKTPHQHRHFLYQKFILNEKKSHEFEQFAAISSLAGIERSLINNYNGFLERENLYQIKISEPKSTTTIIHIHPGCGSYGWQRAWPENYYVELIRKLSYKTKAYIQMTGMGIYEENLISKIIKNSNVPIQNRSGHLEIEQLSNLIRNANLIICGNTGILHLATGLGRPVVTMNGPANPKKWGPIGPTVDSKGKMEKHSAEVSLLLADIHCSPCTTLGFEYGCKLRPCMETITIEKVYQESIRLLTNQKN